ncbi:hypothetical protein VP01_2939g2 [Puccinia sorghi]|uniref:Uncharacterized protein n=1 Tax=Puccinia sorghi TaxID=27349 RepID=A0A0L6V2U5_9BASI|nr:hypothetical protein VP01_2939g2 [Puccinia sorghi]
MHNCLQLTFRNPQEASFGWQLGWRMLHVNCWKLSKFFFLHGCLRDEEEEKKLNISLHHSTAEAVFSVKMKTSIFIEMMEDDPPLQVDLFPKGTGQKVYLLVLSQEIHRKKSSLMHQFSFFAFLFYPDLTCHLVIIDWSWCFWFFFVCFFGGLFAVVWRELVVVLKGQREPVAGTGEKSVPLTQGKGQSLWISPFLLFLLCILAIHCCGYPPLKQLQEWIFRCLVTGLLEMLLWCKMTQLWCKMKPFTRPKAKATCTHCLIRYKGAPFYLARQCVHIAFTLETSTKEKQKDQRKRKRHHTNLRVEHYVKMSTIQRENLANNQKEEGIRTEGGKKKEQTGEEDLKEEKDDGGSTLWFHCGKLLDW